MKNDSFWPFRRDGRPLVIGHRGASAHAPENTLAAFRKAAELGADMWELDIQLTRDGVPVISHDSALERLFGLSHEIADLSFAELRNMAPTIPSFAEAIDLAKALKQALYVEVKAPGSGVVALKLLREKAFTCAGLGSFKMEEVSAMRACIRSGEVTALPLSVLVPRDADPFERAEATDADMIHLCWENAGNGRPQGLVTPELLDEATARDLGIVLWHEERPEVLSEIIRLPVLGVCSNEPEQMVQLLSREASLVACGGDPHEP